MTHLQTVTVTDDDSIQTDTVRRSAPRARPDKSLPTERMNSEVQQRVLQAFGRLSGPSKRPVSVTMLAEAIKDVSKYNVPLSNSFFVEMGWLEKRGRGEYAATDALVAYSVRLANDPANTGAAIKPLRTAMEQSWAWRAVRPMLTFGPAQLTEVRLILMEEAKAGQEHIAQITNLLEWMRFADLITIDKDKVASVHPLGAQTSEPAGSEQQPSPSPAAPAAPPAEPEVPKPTTPLAPPRGAAVVSLSFTLDLTADDLARLSSDQIKALFEGVGAVAAVKNAL
jgi:hypothetical protein